MSSIEGDDPEAQQEDGEEEEEGERTCATLSSGSMTVRCYILPAMGNCSTHSSIPHVQEEGFQSQDSGMQVDSDCSPKNIPWNSPFESSWVQKQRLVRMLVSTATLAEQEAWMRSGSYFSGAFLFFSLGAVVWVQLCGGASVRAVQNRQLRSRKFRCTFFLRGRNYAWHACENPHLSKQKLRITKTKAGGPFS
jgi:hypothetical protein